MQRNQNVITKVILQKDDYRYINISHEYKFYIYMSVANLSLRVIGVKQSPWIEGVHKNVNLIE